MVCLMLLATVLRYSAGISFPWTEEVLKALMAWCVLLLLGSVTRNNGHIRMTFFAEKIFGVRRAPAIWTALENVIGVITCGYFTWVGWRWTIFAFEHNIRPPTTGLPWQYPIWVVQIIFFIGMALVTIYYGEKLVMQLLSWLAIRRKWKMASDVEELLNQSKREA